LKKLRVQVVATREDQDPNRLFAVSKIPDQSVVPLDALLGLEMKRGKKTTSAASLNPAMPTHEEHFVMERKGRIEDLDRSFDVEFWQRQGPAAIFAAAWELVEIHQHHLGRDPNTLRLQRTVERLQRTPD
jgi:hypothetical protein